MNRALRHRGVNLDPIEVLLCDADDCLFASERPAFEASTHVVNRLLAELGDELRFTPEELRRHAAGRNFRSLAGELCAERGVELADAELDRWVAAEREAVIAHLGEALRPVDSVSAPLRRLAGRFGLALVSSSALARLDACLAATGLAPLFPTESRFSAEGSLPEPTSKPDPAIYREAGRRLGVAGERALAIEDSPNGARAAVAAGFPTVGLLQFVPPAERSARGEEMIAIGVAALLESWEDLEAVLSPETSPAAG
ncbi:MAG TPA: HAD family phosphatase [Solirubrobacterales bacterium]|nr:HAD family phosphatase [Solirubrobacterales bacterium]